MDLVLNAFLVLGMVIFIYAFIGFTLGCIDRVMHGPDKKFGEWGAIWIITLMWGVFVYLYVVLFFQKMFNRH